MVTIMVTVIWQFGDGYGYGDGGMVTNMVSTTIAIKMTRMMVVAMKKKMKVVVGMIWQL